ncbi:hypothetical protein D917_06431 [Trichinella nativa]|uniref:Uncharacterized protein n=1 Tax=Trichinella nativa TaxID=6335 RepID=A0A1Y3EYD5_9BILA|nr:hypothetical protein D917_06431 [Trichinella nativa]
MMMKNNILHSSSSNCSAVVGDLTNSNVNLDTLLQILEICQLQRNPTGVIFGKWSTLNDQKYQSGCCHSLRNGIGLTTAECNYEEAAIFEMKKE